jgi:DNA polymerase phi
VDQLSGLIRTSAVPKSDNWVTEVLDFLTLHGLFTVKKKSEKNASALIRSPAKPTFTDELQMACRTKLLSCLADLIGTTTTTKTEDGKTVKATGTAADGQLWVSKVLASVERFENDPKHIVVVSVVDEEERALRMKARDVITGLKTVIPFSALCPF